jgi:hypothetical protein
VAYNIAQAVAHTIANSTTITDLVGTRYYAMVLPQNAAYPAVTWRLLTGLEHHNIDFAYPTYQFDSWAETYAEAKQLAAEVKAVFQRRREVVGETSGVRMVQGVFESEVDLYDDETELFHIATDINLIYRIG